MGGGLGCGGTGHGQAHHSDVRSRGVWAFIWVPTQPAAAIETGAIGSNQAGITLGASAAPLPPGLYMIDDAFYYGFRLTGPGTATAQRASRICSGSFRRSAWVPGWNFLGGTYSALFAFPFNSVSVASAPSAGFPGVSFAGVHNSFIAPLRLQWNLGNGFFAQAGTGVYIPDGNVSGPMGDSNVGAPLLYVSARLCAVLCQRRLEI